MKNPIILFAIIVALISCTKSALQPQQFESIHQRWIVQEGHDTASWSAAQFCRPADYGKIDTIDLYYNNEPENPNKFGYESGSIYFHQPGGRIPTDIPGMYNRYYCKLLTKAE
jgi:hypothetical protein